ncbi:nucleotidyltransferase family protein [Pontibacter anaerobius]|uniref:Nucleotidyltransferase family protein n=1 Tax=Pontibacter anaerobius TaxID=2993940 RepID=A0ABT3RHI7_9BACT|nr:nucleotidyltransferase family protein [Pontibacter anaerobius]MCX2740958.1 nucleotidyltransferase family protein [Pontibacter anaerobius]
MFSVSGLVILAAGASTRLGEPKQLLRYQGKSLLQRATQVALETGFSPVVVVLGANAAILLPEVSNSAVTIVRNPEWQEGMASSIRAGLSELLRLKPELDDVTFMVCDQPYVDAAVLKQLVQAKQDGRSGIVASAYQGTWGTPVLFDKVYFPELLALQGQEGAKKIIMKHKSAVTSISFPAGATDIDTAEDYAALLQTDNTPNDE